MIIDAHQHFWKLDMPFDHAWLAEPQHAAIHKSYLPADLEPLLKSAGVDKAIFVQTQHDVQEKPLGAGACRRKFVSCWCRRLGLI